MKKHENKRLLVPAMLLFLVFVNVTILPVNASADSVAVDSVFESLFYGSGAWLGLLLFIILCVGLIKKWKYAGALLIPIIIGMEISYYDRLSEGGNFVWHMLILLVLAVFVGLYAVAGKDD